MRWEEERFRVEALRWGVRRILIETEGKWGERDRRWAKRRARVGRVPDNVLKQFSMCPYQC